MARGGGSNDRERRRAPKDTARRGKKKVCIFCKEHIEWVDYKDVNLLRRFMSDRGKIRARRVTSAAWIVARERASSGRPSIDMGMAPRPIALTSSSPMRRVCMGWRPLLLGAGGERSGAPDGDRDAPDPSTLTPKSAAGPMEMSERIQQRGR